MLYNINNLLDRNTTLHAYVGPILTSSMVYGKLQLSLRGNLVKHVSKTCKGSFRVSFGAEVKSRTLYCCPLLTFQSVFPIEAGGDSQDFDLICPKRFNSRNGESPAGGDNVRRQTFGKTAIVYEAEAQAFRLWVLSHFTQCSRDGVTNIARPFPSIVFAVCSVKCSKIIRVLVSMLWCCRST